MVMGVRRIDIYLRKKGSGGARESFLFWGWKYLGEGRVGG